MSTTPDYLSATLLGVLAGMRSMTPPTLVSYYLNNNQPQHSGTLVNLLRSRRSLQIFALLAAGEITADKFPQTPNRTFAPALVGRVGTSMLATGALCQARGQAWQGAAALSALLTVVATFATFRARIAANRALPNPVTGIMEDGVLLGISASLLRRWQGLSTA